MPVRSPPVPGRYRDLRFIGRGGMAEIYRATDTVLGRDVAVKVLADATADEEERARFKREALTAARLSGQPHTVSTYDVGEIDGRPFLVLQYLGGGSLADRLRSGRVSQAQALAWLEQAARALDFAHARGVVHRDVKPANLLLDESGNVYVADFGIARADGLESHTQTGVVLGTAGYLAPEQARGDRATAASDRYALALVAYELLTGSGQEDTASHGLPAGPRAVFERALAARPEERFPSCTEFVAELRAALAPSEAPTLVQRPRRSRRAASLIGLALFLGPLGVVLAIGLSAQGGSAGPGKPAPTRLIVRTVTAPAAAAVQPAAAVRPSVAPEAREQDEDRGKARGKGRGKGRGHGKKEKD